MGVKAKKMGIALRKRALRLSPARLILGYSLQFSSMLYPISIVTYSYLVLNL